MVKNHRWNVWDFISITLLWLFGAAVIASGIYLLIELGRSLSRP